MPKKKTAKGDPRSEGRKVIGDIRVKLNSMNGTQLRAFYAGFSEAQIKNHLSAIEKVQESRNKKEISKTEEEIKRLQEKLKTLKK